VNQNTPIPSLEDIVWAELLWQPTLKQINRNSEVLGRYATNGWISHTSRKDEFAITELGRRVAEKRLTENWIAWKSDLESFQRAGLSPEDLDAWRMIRRLSVRCVPRKLKKINRRTLSAWERKHSKVSFGAVSEQFKEATVTIDEITRIRLPSGSKLLLKDGTSSDCDLNRSLFGEVNIPERAWNHIQQIDAPDSRVIFSIENKGAFVDFPDIPFMTLIFCPGDNISAMREVISRIAQQPTVHFGDLDPKGIEIYEMLRREGLVQYHFIPTFTEEFLPTHAMSCETVWPQRDYSQLHSAIAKLVTMRSWLEQEALVLDSRFQQEIELYIEHVCKEGSAK
jgi:hypothetical protein